MKRKLLAVLVLVSIMLGTFTGCEPMPTLSAIVSTTKGFNNEIIALIISQVEEDYSPDDFPEDLKITVDEGLTCTVEYSGLNSLELLVTLDDWVANDGTEISGTIMVDIDYYSSPISVSSISMEPAMIYFDRTSVSYVSEVLDGDATTETFTPGSSEFICISIIVDGKTLVNNIVGLYK